MKETVRKWLGTKPYTKATYITAVSTIVMAVMSGIMCLTVVQNRESLELTAESLSQSREALGLTQESLTQGAKALRLTEESLALQEQEFRLRNRPFIVIRNYKFSGQDENTAGKIFPHTVQFELVNIAEVPANSLSGEARAILNDGQPFSTAISPTALSGAGTAKMRLFLSKEMYAAATNDANNFEIRTRVAYGGMLGEPGDAYCTEEIVRYSPVAKAFKLHGTHTRTYR